jgi:hypothetical protein
MATSSDGSGVTARRVRIAVQFVVGVALLGYGLALLTDTVSWTPPAAVYFAASIALFAYAYLQWRGMV